MRYCIAVFVFCAAIVGMFGEQPASAVKPFLEQFKALYVKPKTTDHTMLIFNAAVEKKDCTICHLAKPQKGFNAYGAQVKKLLAKNDAQNPKAIRIALSKAARMKANPDDPQSLTFGQRLQQGKLPVGEIHVRPRPAAD